MMQLIDRVKARLSRFHKRPAPAPRSTRYDQLLQLIHETKPASIVEIGTWTGARAVALATAALRHSPQVHYTGYDLFESATPELNTLEFNAKPNQTLNSVWQRLEELSVSTDRRFTFELVKGNTNETMRDHHDDFAFIDGGHSLATIQSDYSHVRHCRTVVFDDYYLADSEGRIPDTSAVGCNQLVDSLADCSLLDCEGDRVKGGGLVCLAVQRNAT